MTGWYSSNMAISSTSAVGPERGNSFPTERGKEVHSGGEGSSTESLPTVALNGNAASAGASRFRAKVLGDVSRVQAFHGAKTAVSKQPKVSPIMEVTVPWNRSTECLKVKTQRVGSFEGGMVAYSLKFTTVALGIKSPVNCSIIVCLDSRLKNPQEAVEKAVRQHCYAIAEGGTKALKSMGNYYVARPGKKGGESEVGQGYPGGRYTADPGVEKPKTGNTRPDGSVVENSPNDVEILLSDGKNIHTTAERLKFARTLAGQITFVVDAEGKRHKAGGQFVEGVAQRLAAFSVADMKSLKDNEYTFCFVDSNNKPKGGYPGGRGAPTGKGGNWKEGVGGYAAYGDKVIVIPYDSIGKVAGGDSDVLLHEISHAVSDCRVSDRFFGAISRSLDNDGEVVKFFQAYAKRCGYDTGKGREGTITKHDAVWSTYACQGSQEYLAEGITYLKQGGASRALLKSKDPAFYEKLLKLFPEDATDRS